MSIPLSDSPELPRLPGLLAWPLGLLPGNLPARAVARLLNRMLLPQLRAGELDFLTGKRLRIRVEDGYLNLCLTVQDGWLRACPRHAGHHAGIEGGAYAFLLLATRREDPDTLFFNRQLRLNGETELGLHVKNFLDSLEPEQFGGMHAWLEQALDAWDRHQANPIQVPSAPILRINVPLPPALKGADRGGF